MSNPNEVNALFFGGESSGLFYQIDRSLRFDRSTSSNLNRTPSVAGNFQRYTVSAWVKRAAPFGVTAPIFMGTNAGASQNDGIYFTTSDQFSIAFNGAVIATSTAVYRDPGAWMNVILAVDTTQFTPADRFKVYINGILVTSYASTAYPVQNATGLINTTNPHYIGRSIVGTDTFPGYMTEIHFIDGVQADPSDFGIINPFTNEWQPIPYIGVYGTNGFYVNFSDNSNTTATTLGKDYSGNGNNWTPNGFSVAAGVNNDSVIDVPTRWDDGGNCRGNYPTWNNVTPVLNNSWSDGNLRASIEDGYAISTINIPSIGKWYFECTVVTVQTSMLIGIARQNIDYQNNLTSSNFRTYQNNGNKSAGTSTAYGATYTTNDVIGVAVDSDAGTVTFYKNNVSQGVAYNDLNSAGGPWAPFTLVSASNSAVITFNAGQQGFAYAPPTGFKAVNTFNMPLPAVSSGQEFVEPRAYTGNGFTQSVTGLQFQPDLTWIKARTLTEYGRMVDSLRGATLAIQSGNGVAQQTESTGLTSFDPSGFSLGTSAGYNASGSPYISWNWVAAPTTVNNTSGTISSQTRSNPTAGFSIVRYTGTGVNATVGHGAGATPMFIIIKNITGTTQGACYHASLGAGSYLPFEQTSGRSGTTSDTTVFNNTAPTSTQFSVGTSSRTNTLGNEYMAYVWAEVPGYSTYGTYQSSANLPYQHCGFLPSIVMTRNGNTGTPTTSNPTSAHLVKDDQRGEFGNQATSNLSWTSNNGQNTNTNANNGFAGEAIDLISSGWKLRGFSARTTNDEMNSNNFNNNSFPSVTMYWVAWARSPAKYTNAR